MTDPGPFAPPSGAVPPRPPDLAPAAPLPPPTGAPAPFGAPSGPPTAPPPAPRRRWLVPVVVGGSIAVLALFGGVIALAVQLGGMLASASAFDSEGDAPNAGGPIDPGLDDLLDGDPGSPVAAEPLTCAECFRPADLQNLTLPDASYLRVGLAIGDDSLTRISASEDQHDQTGWWVDDGGAPDACYFTYPKAPLFFDPGIVDDLPARGDTVLYPAWHTDRDEYYLFSVGIRVFDDTDAATAYMTRLETAIADCPHYSLSESGWTAAVSPTPAMQVPASVASYGWVESDGHSRYFATDVQRGNAVVRLTLSTDAYGPSETDFRDLVAEYADLLASVAPAS